MKFLLLFTLTSFLVTFTLYSCKKDKGLENINKEPAKMASMVYAGVHDSSFYYNNFQTAVQIATTYDAQNIYASGSDSIDLDSNGTYDLFISLRLMNEDSIHLLPILLYQFPHCSLKTSNEFQLSFEDVYYPIGLGMNGILSFVNKIDYNTLISSTMDWQNEGLLWQQSPSTSGNPPKGPWYIPETSYFYIGIRKNGNNYGWIEVDASDPRDPKFLAVALKM